MPKDPAELRLKDVYKVCDPSTLGFSSTAELPILDKTIGQTRATTSVDFGLAMPDNGYNIFAVGPAGTGKTTMLLDVLTEDATSRPAPDDWVYVHNFSTPHKPNAIRMPAGKARQFSKHMDKLIEELSAAITRSFQSEEYEKQKSSIVQKMAERQETKLTTLGEKAEAAGITIVRTPAGIALAPKTPTGEAMSREQFEELPADEKARIDEDLKTLNEELQQAMRRIRQQERDGREAVRDLDMQVAKFAAKPLIDETAERWETVPETGEYFETVLADVVESIDDFRKSEDKSPPAIAAPTLPGRGQGQDVFRRYKVNVLVDNSALEGAPLVNETNPVMQNLLGRVEHQASFGALFTDFNMIKPGALHKANGGFLVLEARELLTKPYAWDALKRTIKTGEIRVEDVAQQMGLAATTTIDPEPIPFSAKIVLIGEPFIYYLLFADDPDFRELFKVKADFSDVADRTKQNEKLYARFVARLCEQRELPHASVDGVARVIEHCSRLAADQRKLTTRFMDVADLLTEAAHWARKGRPARARIRITREHVQKAIDQQLYRSSLTEERLRDMITDGTVLVDTRGETVGQVTGLSVLSMGDHTFGRPSRITALHHLGDGKVIDIEREVEMGGPIHSKGVMILAGYLAARYASDTPLSLNARLVFEQSYSGVEGDSASSAELYALLSSLSGVPIQQRFAVTGSINQRGQIQAIGGVNQKIEGYFDVCEALGLKGDESVLIPKSNVPNLMLADRVRDAIEAGRFHIYPVRTVDEGIALLTGVPAGSLGSKGTYTVDSINRLVVDRLAALTAKARASTKKRTD